VRYGIVPAGGATVRLAERLEPSRAAQLYYTGALVDAEALKDWGLVNEVVAGERLMERAREIAQEICQRSPEAIRHIKALTRPGDPGGTRAARIRAELESFEKHLHGKDLARGLAAFRSKQKPVF
jgi:enoyl-CoA hydratase/carnithine racemase